MGRPWHRLIETVTVAEPRDALGLRTFGLCGASENGLAYTTLGEAIAAGMLNITESARRAACPRSKL